MTALSSVAGRPAFPARVEECLIAQCRRALGAEEGQHDLVPRLTTLVAELSDGFTVARKAGFGGYAARKDLLAAYNLFFFPRSFVQTQFLLEELAGFRGWIPAPGPVRVLDLGAGTGAAGLAAAHFLAGPALHREVELTAVDASGEALAFLEEVFRTAGALWPHARLKMQRADLRRWSGAGAGWDLVIVCLALNEVIEDRPEDPAERVKAILSHVSPTGVLLLIEPGTQEAGTRMAAVRDALAADPGLTVLAPCLHHGPCPLRRSGDVWCHEVRSWRPPDSLSLLNRHLFRDVRHLTFTGLAVGRGARSPSPESTTHRVRMVSPMRELKGAICAYGCGADGLVRRYEFATRGLSRPEKQDRLSMERGDIVDWCECRLLGDGRTQRATAVNRVFGFRNPG